MASSHALTPSPAVPTLPQWPGAGMRAKLIALAQHAAPRECCGWLTAHTVRIADNIAASDTEFEFAAADLLALARAHDLPASHPDRPLAIFHSHPHGPDQLSVADLASAIVRVGTQSPQPCYTPQQILIVGPRWRIVHFEFDATTPTMFRQLGGQP